LRARAILKISNQGKGPKYTVALQQFAICVSAGKYFGLIKNSDNDAQQANEWFSRGLELLIGHSLPSRPAEQLYQTARCVYNKLTKDATSPERATNLMNCMRLVCDCTVYTDGLDPARREKVRKDVSLQPRISN